jgi:tetratricopeptide (TPR) repeat protein
MTIFAMAARDHNFRSPAGYQLALLESRRGNFLRALDRLRDATYTNSVSPDIISLMISLNRLTGNLTKATEFAKILLEIDPLNLKAHYEMGLISNSNDEGKRFESMMRNYHENYLELAVKYRNAGLIDDAAALLEQYLKRAGGNMREYPMVFYWLGYFYDTAGDTLRAGENFRLASESDPAFSFPFRLESLRVLEKALEYDPDDALAWYLKGNIYYENQPDSAIQAWNRSLEAGNEMPVVYRNLAYAHAHANNDPEAAIKYMENAMRINPDDPRYYYEYELYSKALLTGADERIEPFLSAHNVVKSGQLSKFPYARLLTVTGRYDEAINLMNSGYFFVREDEPEIYHYWLYSHLFKARGALEAGLTVEAGLLLEAALSYPGNLQSSVSSHEPIVYYYKGLLAERLKNTAEAEASYLRAVQCTSGAPECDYFAAIAYDKLKKSIASQSIFTHMIEGGQLEIKAAEEKGHFNSLMDVISLREYQANAYLRIALGYKGTGDEGNAEKYYRLALQHDPDLITLVFRN